MKKVTILALIVALASPALALSQKDKKEKKEKGKDKSADVQMIVVFGNDDREATHAYFSKKYGKGNCPPGLAKKNNGCLPPGHAKKRYQVGQRRRCCDRRARAPRRGARGSTPAARSSRSARSRTSFMPSPIGSRMANNSSFSRGFACFWAVVSSCPERSVWIGQGTHSSSRIFMRLSALPKRSRNIQAACVHAPE